MVDRAVPMEQSHGIRIIHGTKSMHEDEQDILT